MHGKKSVYVYKYVREYASNCVVACVCLWEGDIYTHSGRANNMKLLRNKTLNLDKIQHHAYIYFYHRENDNDLMTGYKRKLH